MYEVLEITTKWHWKWFHHEFWGKQFKVQFNKEYDYVAFKQFAINRNYLFHIYLLLEEKTIIVILKGLPNIPNLKVIEELRRTNIDIKTYIQINSKESLHAIFRINLNAKYSLSCLHKIRYFLNTIGINS